MFKDSPSHVVTVGRGIYEAVVTNNVDPHHKLRVKVKLPLSSDTYWCRGCVTPSKHGKTATTLPKVGDTVWVMFIDGDVNRPVWLGIDPGA